MPTRKKPRRSTSIQLKLTVFVGLVVVLTAEILSLAGFLYSRHLLLDQINSRLTVVAAERQGRLLDYIHTQLDRLTIVVSRARLAEWLDDQAGALAPYQINGPTTKILRDLQRATAGAQAVWLAEPGGKIIAATDAALGRDLAADPDFLAGRLGPRFGAPRLSGGKYETLLAVPVTGANNQLRGVLLILLDARPIQRLLGDPTGLGQTGEVIVGTPEQRHLHCLFRPRSEPRLLDLPLPSLPAMQAALAGQAGFTETRDEHNAPILAAYRPVGYGGWGMVVRIDEAEAYAPILDLRHLLFALTLAILALGATVSYLIARRFVEPLRDLVAATEAVVADNLRVCVLAAPGLPELAALAAAFNRMTERLAESYATLERKVAERTAQLEKRTEQLGQSEQAVRNQTEVLQSILDRMGDGVIVMDARGKLVVFNAAAQRILGLGPSNAPLGAWPETYGFFRADSMTRMLADELPLARALRGESTDQVEMFVKNTMVPVGVAISVTGRPLRDERGGLRGGVIVFREITGQKRAATLLATERNLLRTLIDNLPDYIFIKDAAGSYIVNNQAHLRLLRVTRAEETIGKTDVDFFPRELAQQYAAEEQAIMLSGRPVVDREEVLIDHEGQKRWLSTTKLPLRDAGGRSIGLVAIGRDITARKRVELTLRNSEALYHSLVESLPLSVFRKDCEGRFTFGNGRFLVAVGRSLPELAGKTDFDFYPHELAEKYRANDQRVIVHGEVFEDIEEHQDPGGERRYVHVLKTRVYDARGDVVGTQGLFWDVTALKRAENALAAERDLLHSLMDNIPDTIYFKDNDGRFTRINQAQAQLLGVARPADAVGKTDFDFFSADHARDAFADEQKILQTRQPLVGKVEKIVGADGSVRWVSSTKSPIVNHAGQVTGIVGISRDITDLEQAQFALTNTAADLARSNADLEQFAYIASHDLQEPLRLVNSYLQLLQTQVHGKLGVEADQYINYASDGAKRMRTLITDLLAYSRASTQAAIFAPTDCAVLLARVLETLRVTIAESKAQVTHDAQPTVPADPTQLEQLFQNLLGNALKFHQPGKPPRVHISAHRDGDVWTFAVKDHGIGIAPEHQPRLFAVFQRLHTQAEYPGTGLGLVICKRIVERHHGRIWLESEPGKGTTFFFTLPLQEK